jgi:hypothetical protein
VLLFDQKLTLGLLANITREAVALVKNSLVKKEVLDGALS